MEFMDHGSKNLETMESMGGAGGEDEQALATLAGTVYRPRSSEAIIRQLIGWNVGKGREQAALLERHGLETMANQIACLRWEIAKGGATAPRKPGAVLRHRLTAGIQPPEAFYALLRSDRQHEVVAPKPAARPAADPVDDRPLVVLPPLLAKLVRSLQSVPSQAWAMSARSLIETGEATLTADDHLAVNGANPVGARLVRKWADQITALGVVRGVCFA